MAPTPEPGEPRPAEAPSGSEFGRRAALGTARGTRRVVAAWRQLAPDQRLAGIAAIGLFVSLFLPWYQHTVIASVPGKGLAKETDTLTAWGAFSFVEAAVLLVAAFVLWLLVCRGEGRDFHLPFGDGVVIVGAGAWAAVLVVWRMFDRQGTRSAGDVATSYTIEWGIFAALAMAVLLAYAGSRIHAAQRPEPPLMDGLKDEPAPAPAPAPTPAVAVRQVTTETAVLPDSGPPTESSPTRALPHAGPPTEAHKTKALPAAPPGGDGQLTMPLDESD
jgi:hypothetical protein